MKKINTAIHALKQGPGWLCGSAETLIHLSKETP
jgi:hypothetical protein